jgi:methylenetetrahydrofolate reductase (NADPH)
VARARREGIQCRIIPGSYPDKNIPSWKDLSILSRASIPSGFLQKLEYNRYNSEAVYKAGMDFAIDQCRDLLTKGAPGIHFYTLNKSRATVEIYRTLKVR